MSTAELVQEIKRLSNADRLKIIEAATAFIRDDLLAQDNPQPQDVGQRIRAAAIQAKDLYEPGGELSEWTALDGEEVIDDSVSGHLNHAIQG